MFGTHSIIKDTTTYALSGSAANSSSVAIKNQGGWTLGTVRDIYMLYEKEGDHQLCWSNIGWIASGYLLVLRFQNQTFGFKTPMSLKEY